MHLSTLQATLTGFIGSLAQQVATGQRFTVIKYWILKHTQIVCSKMLFWENITQVQNGTSQSSWIELDKQQWHIEKKQVARITLLMRCKW